jgi:hypothetical protein
MREDDDDAADHSSTAGDLADGLGETAEPGSSSIDPYGDESFDDPYGDEGLDDTYGDDTDGEDGSTTDADDGYDGGYGDDGYGDDADADTSAVDTDPADIGPEAADPLEGVGFLLDELRDALFGDDDGSAAAVAEPDPGPDVAELASDADLDLTGDGVVDGADLHEGASPFDFGVG